MESSINGFHERNERYKHRKEDSFHTEKAWEDKMRKEKKRKRKDYEKSLYNLKEKWHQKGGDSEKDSIADIVGMTDNTHNSGQSIGLDICSDKSLNGATKKKTDFSSVPTMNECAERLLEKVSIICINSKLYYFNGRCYQPLDKVGLVKIFREKVSNNLYNSKSMKQFYELYDYLLTDPKLKGGYDSKKLSNLAILANGIYHIKSGKLEEFNPSIIAFSYVNANYVENVKCPQFDKFLYDITGGDSILIERFWMFLGYVFSQSLDAKAFFVMGHASNSGKSVLGKFIENLYDKQYISSVALSDFNGDFSMGPLVGAAVNISLDLPNSRLNAVAVSKLKMLTGGDSTTINEKYVPLFQYENRAKFIFASNHPLKLTEDDEAFWERLVYLPFDYSIDKENQKVNLLEKLLRERDAVVSKALKYAKKLMKLHYQFPTTDAIERRVCEWRGINVDTIDAFIKKCCDIDLSYKGEIIEDLYSRYIQFCDDENEKPKARNDFKKYLELQVGLKHFKMRRGKTDNPQSAFQGIKIMKEGGF